LSQIYLKIDSIINQKKGGHNIMNETILIIILAFGIGNHIEKQKPKEMLLELGDGSIIETIIDDNNNYYCPQYCSAKHKHYSHYDNTKCSMKNKCYHFVHNNEVNLASIINEDSNNSASNDVATSKTPEIVTASIDKKPE
jgi:hypothetical protein